MKKIGVIGATLLGATVLCAAPISLHLSQDKGMSLSADKAQARIGRPLTPGHLVHPIQLHSRGYMAKDLMPGHPPPGTPCREAAKLEFPTDRKARRAYRHECKQAWKAQNKGA